MSYVLNCQPHADDIGLVKNCEVDERYDISQFSQT